MEKPKEYADMKQLEERAAMGKSTKANESENVLFENLLPMGALLERLGGKFSRKTVYKWTAYSDIPHRKIRGRLFFDPVEVAKWLERTS